MRLNIARTLHRSAVNGPGERFVLWVQGCPLACPGCWNPDTWAFEKRRLVEVDELAETILSTEGIEGVTFSGGEPFAQARSLAALAGRVWQHGLSVMVFTGYTMEELTSAEHQSLLRLTDVVVTGRYRAKESSVVHPWKGSRNQTVCFLTSRYSQDDVPGLPQTEVHIDELGQVFITGFPTEQLVTSLMG